MVNWISINMRELAELIEAYDPPNGPSIYIKQSNDTKIPVSIPVEFVYDYH